MRASKASFSVLTTGQRPAQLQASRGFTLVEVVIALGITAFCLAILLGLFAVGLRNSRESAEQILAAHLAQSIIDTRRAAPTATFTGYFPLPATGTFLTPGGAAVTGTKLIDQNGNVTTSATSAQYGLTYTITPPAIASSTSSGTLTLSGVQLYLCLYWPPQTTLATSVGRYEIVTQLSH
jgi:uncharacterized protein (TIGR02598 family)